jgi:hypothetical protein
MNKYTSCPWCDATDKDDRRTRFGCVQCQHEFHNEPNLSIATDNTQTLVNALADIELLTLTNKNLVIVNAALMGSLDAKKAALRVALDALKSVQDHRPNDETNNAITTIKEAL